MKRSANTGEVALSKRRAVEVLDDVCPQVACGLAGGIHATRCPLRRHPSPPQPAETRT